MELYFRDVTQKSICSDHTGGGLLTFMGDEVLWFPHELNSCVWAPRFDGEILNQDTSVVWTFYRVLNTVRLKCGGIIKNGWMIDPLNLATKHDEYLAPSWRKLWVLLDLPHDCQDDTDGGWALPSTFCDAILCHYCEVLSILEVTESLIPCFVSKSSKLLAVSLYPTRPLQLELSCRSCSNSWYFAVVEIFLHSEW